ncbi:MAG: alkaline phosphatase D family protein [Myxococcota bacterium]
MRPIATSSTRPRSRSEVGVFRTALAPGAARRLRFGASSCTNAALYPWPTLARAAELELDFYLLLGDTTYCDGAVTLDEYRRKWQFTRESAEYRALFASCGVYATWDDHEVTNDWDPETVDPTQLAVALQAFEEHVPIGLRSPDGSVRIWRSQRWGDTLELFVLDCRSERRPSTAHTPAAQYVSRAQLDWLEQGLAASTARWKVIVNSVPIAHMPDYFQQEKDRWDKYEVQRDELLAFIADLGPEARVVWVAGDYHFAALMHIDRPGDPGAPELSRREILTSPAGNAPNAYWPRVLTDDVVQFEWADGTPNVAVVTLDPDADEIESSGAPATAVCSPRAASRPEIGLTRA